MPRVKVDRTCYAVPPVSQRNLPRNSAGEVIVTDNVADSYVKNKATQCLKEDDV